MPNYNGHKLTGSPCPIIDIPSSQQTLWNAESPTTGQISQQCSVAQAAGAGAQKSISVQFTFSGNPGTFTFQILDSDTDLTSASYLNVPSGGSLTTATLGSDGKYYTKTELVPFAGQFVAISCVAQTQNPVTVTALVTLQ